MSQKRRYSSPWAVGAIDSTATEALLRTARFSARTLDPASIYVRAKSRDSFTGRSTMEVQLQVVAAEAATEATVTAEVRALARDAWAPLVVKPATLLLIADSAMVLTIDMRHGSHPHADKEEPWHDLRHLDDKSFVVRLIVTTGERRVELYSPVFSVTRPIERSRQSSRPKRRSSATAASGVRQRRVAAIVSTADADADAETEAEAELHLAAGPNDESPNAAAISTDGVPIDGNVVATISGDDGAALEPVDLTGVPRPEDASTMSLSLGCPARLDDEWLLHKEVPDKRTRERQQLRSEQERLRAEQEQLRVGQEQLRVERQQLRVEQEKEREELRAEKQHLRAEGQHLRTEKEQLRSEREQLREKLRAKKQRMLAAQERIRAEQEKQRGELLVEKQRMRGEQEQKRAEREELRAEKQHLRAEKEALLVAQEHLRTRQDLLLVATERHGLEKATSASAVLGTPAANNASDIVQAGPSTPPVGRVELETPSARVSTSSAVDVGQPIELASSQAPLLDSDRCADGQPSAVPKVFVPAPPEATFNQAGWCDSQSLEKCGDSPIQGATARKRLREALDARSPSLAKRGPSKHRKQTDGETVEGISAHGHQSYDAPLSSSESECTIEICPHNLGRSPFDVLSLSLTPALVLDPNFARTVDLAGARAIDRVREEHRGDDNILLMARGLIDASTWWLLGYVARAIAKHRPVGLTFPDGVNHPFVGRMLAAITAQLEPV